MDSLLRQRIKMNDTSAPRRFNDTIPADTAAVRVAGDSMDLAKISADTLDAPIFFKVKDSSVTYVKQKIVRMYGSADVKYKEINVTGDRMFIDQETGILRVTPSIDSLGKKTGRPVFNDGSQSTEQDSIVYSIVSQRAKIYGTKAQYGEGYISSQQVKKAADNTVFGFKNGYTTCNLDTPHFAFRARKIKVIPNKLIISGPANLEIQGIPTPLYIPFAIFPITSGQRSGILVPQYTVNQQKGIGLENGGYYIGLGEYLDLTVRGNIYSYGSWGTTFSPTYRKRYRYNGGLNFSIANTRFGDKEVKEDFSVSRDFNVTWNHSMDSKARPGTNFSANVHFGTSNYNSYNVTDYQTRLNNILTSSIAYSKSWQGKPYNLTLSLNHSQNTATRDVTITAPEAAFTVNTLYPFQRDGGAGNPRWYEKIGISYTGNLRNTTTFKDSTFGKAPMWDRLQTGMQHQIPLSFSIPLGRSITLSPSVSYSEKWYTKKLNRTWNEADYKIDSVYENGFYSMREVSTGMSLATSLYGMYTFNKGKVQQIRHVMRPTVSFSYKPDLSEQYYYNLRYDTTANAVQRVSYFDGSVFGPPSSGTFGGISFGLDNNLEMKMRKSKKDTADAKKIKLLDGFGINGSYNLVADSFQLSTFSIYARTNLFDKVNISANGVIDPYQLDSLGRRLDKYTWQGIDTKKLGRLTSMNVAISTSFQSQDKKSKEKEQKKDEILENETTDAQLEAQRRQLEMTRANPGEYVDFDIPWRIDLSYSLNYTKTRTADYRRDTTVFTQYLSFNGDFSLTPNWKIGMSSGYDFRLNQISYTTMYVSRDLHCWQMSINLVPFGSYRSFSITISPKAGILRDLRVNRTRQFYDL
ncbi:putative LPS assembly protein LptD [uncultured Chitinophaga sp.]|uniref:putative LPS assembly protein LptD n=1 Tax=uncultured Chitinophaga sp. TaxID=339340 RepID=UPI0025E76DBE|nr:putative LPS assembly protein LptD [uncultured Chitinophaga sp.]